MAKRAQAGLKELPAEEAPAEWLDGPEAQPDAAPAVVAGIAVADGTADPAAAPRWRVALNCPTPLAHTELVVEAAGADEARELFMAANGICGSNHDWTVTRVN